VNLCKFYKNLIINLFIYYREIIEKVIFIVNSDLLLMLFNPLQHASLSGYLNPKRLYTLSSVWGRNQSIRPSAVYVIGGETIIIIIIILFGKRLGRLEFVFYQLLLVYIPQFLCGCHWSAETSGESLLVSWLTQSTGVAL
jgi:hypothetical protein